MGLATSLGFVKNVVFGAYLSPEFLGYFSIAITIASYSVFLQLGLMSGLYRELPVRLGNGDEKYCSGLVGETTISVLVLQLIGIILYSIIILNLNFEDISKKNAFFLGGLLAFSTPFGQIVLLRLRAEQRILCFSVLQFLNSLLILFLGLAAIKYMGYKGAIFTVIMINLFSFILVSKWFLSPVNYLHFRLKDIFYLIRIGLPMMAAGVMVTLQMSMDRLFLFKTTSASEIGIYYFSLIPLTFGMIISGIIDQYIGPKLLFRYGQGYSLKYIFNRVFLVSLGVIVIMVLFVPLVSPTVSFIINRWLPEYKDSISLMPIFYLGAIFTAVNITGVVINAANRQILIFCGTAFVVAICFVGYALVSYYAMTIKWYAYVNVAGQLISFLIVTGISYYVANHAQN